MHRDIERDDIGHTTASRVAASAEDAVVAAAVDEGDDQFVPGGRHRSGARPLPVARRGSGDQLQHFATDHVAVNNTPGDFPWGLQVR